MNLKPILLIAIFAIHLYNSEGQNTEHHIFSRDTSFNIVSEFNKQVKHHPHIVIAEKGDSSELIIHRDIAYYTPKTRSLKLDIIHPVTTCESQKHPVIILIHGGGWRSGDKKMEHPLAYALARKGYATVCVEYRLSMEATYPAAIQDLIAAIRWVKNQSDKYPFDTRKIVLQGTSAGGQLAALLGSINATKNIFEVDYLNHIKENVQAVVNIDGVLAFIHPESGEGHDRPDRPSAATLWFGSTVNENPEARHQASALTHVNENTAPMLFINSSIPRFRAGRDDMIDAMKRYGIYTRHHVHEGSMHTFWLFNPWFEPTVDLIDAFLRDVL
ncbi:alpha/beta hydrolase [Alkaliflexus imshenetskii]|uniref:alpha/beta hydrolase n=1 Tax=Alkaliflexus imshenetskii TaxID=286730 RepID=UPI00047A2840|nr:alpha/beta hydrolase [Alkaliflexus imshenetskii]